MSRKELNWQNTFNNANVGTGAFTSGSEMLASAIDKLQKPLDRANEITQNNAASERSANTGALMRAIYAGEDPELTGAYNGNKVADAQFKYDKQKEANRLAQERLNLSRSRASGRRSRTNSRRTTGNTPGVDLVNLVDNFNKTSGRLHEAGLESNPAGVVLNEQRTPDGVMLNQQIAELPVENVVPTQDDVVTDNYNSMIAYGLKNPKKFKQAQAQFNAWKKDYTAAPKLTKVEKDAAKLTAKFNRQKEEAAHWQKVGYNKNGTPFRTGTKSKKQTKTEKKAAEVEATIDPDDTTSMTDSAPVVNPSSLVTEQNIPAPVAADAPVPVSDVNNTNVPVENVVPIPVVNNVDNNVTPVPDQEITFADRVETPAIDNADSEPVELKEPEEDPGFIDNAIETVSDWLGGDEKTQDQKIEDTLSLDDELEAIDTNDDLTKGEKRSAKAQAKREYKKKRDQPAKDHANAKHLKSFRLEDIYSDGMTPTDEELRDMSPEMINKLRGGYYPKKPSFFGSDAKPANGKVFRDRRGQPVIFNGDYVYTSGTTNGSPDILYNKKGERYSPPMKNAPLTKQERDYDNRRELKRMPKGTRLLKDGRYVLPDGTIIKKTSKK